MTGTEILVALADSSTRDQVRRILGLPTDSVADRLDSLTLAQVAVSNAVKELAVEVKELAAAQARTDQTVKELAAAQARTDQTVKELAAAQARTEQTVKELGLEVKELAVEVKELARISKETRRAVAALSDNVGFGLEELAAIVLPDVLREKRQVQVSGFERRFISTTAGEEEVDLYGGGTRDGEEVVVVVEVKSRIYRGEVERFARRVERLRAEAPRPLIPVMFGFVVHPSASQAARETGVLVVASKPSSLAS